MELNQGPPVSTESGEGRQPISRITAIVLTLGFVLASATAFIVAFYTGFCTLFGETCSEAEQSRINVLNAMGLACGIGGPILVAWLRRAAVWALTPLLLIAAGLVAWTTDVLFDL